MSATNDDIEQAVAEHYADHGEGIFSCDLCDVVGMSRSGLEMRIELSPRIEVQTKREVNEATCDRRRRKSKRYYPTINSMRTLVVFRAIRDNDIDATADMIISSNAWRLAFEAHQDMNTRATRDDIIDYLHEYDDGTICARLTDDLRALLTTLGS